VEKKSKSMSLCRKAFAWYKYTGDWLCKSKTNINTPVRLSSTGEIECLSIDGVNSTRNATNNEKCKELTHNHRETVKCQSKKEVPKKKKLKKKSKQQTKIVGRKCRAKKKHKEHKPKSKIYKYNLRKKTNYFASKINKKWCRKMKLLIYYDFVDFEGPIIHSPDKLMPRNVHITSHRRKRHKSKKYMKNVRENESSWKPLTNDRKMLKVMLGKYRRKMSDLMKIQRELKKKRLWKEYKRMWKKEEFRVRNSWRNLEKKFSNWKHDLVPKKLRYHE